MNQNYIQEIEKVIEDVQKETFFDYICPLCEYNENKEDLASGPCSRTRCFKLAKRYKEAMEGPSWIPCSEKLPEPETEVLVSFSDGTVNSLWQKWAISDGGNYPGEPLAYVMDGYFPETAEDWEKYKVYAEAWMPLPEAYREV